MNNLIMDFKKVFTLFVFVSFPFYIFSQCHNNPGTINKITKFIGQSSRHDLNDTIFLCWEDRFYLDHNDDFELPSDPVPSTKSAIGYAWYKDKPAISGDNLDLIKSDDIFTLPNDTNIVVTVDKANGDALFENRFFNNSLPFNKALSDEGHPSLIYYAPITVDKKQGKRGYFENGGPCVKVNVEEAFPVVYLNPIQISGVNYSKDSLILSFVINGGLPEYYQYKENKTINYSDITILNYKYDTSDYKFLSQNHGPGDTVFVQLPGTGTYKIEVSDSISCSGIKYLNINKAINPTLALDTISGQKGDVVCLPFSVKDFKNIEIIFGRFDYDPSVLEYFSYDPVYPILCDIVEERPGLLRMDWTPSIDSFPEGIVFNLCFKLIGNPGECSPVLMKKFQGANSDIQDIFPYYKQGMICIDPPDGLYISADFCGSEPNVPESTINFKVFNGVAPYFYIAKDSVGNIVETGIINNENTETLIADLFPGSYIIEVSDSSGDVVEKTINIPDTPPLQFEEIQITNPCFDWDIGKIAVKVKDSGASSYTINWSNNNFNVDYAYGLNDGMYHVTLKDKITGCKTDTAIFLKTKIFNIESINPMDASCFGNCDASAEVNVSKNFDFPLFYKWDSTYPDTLSKAIDSLCAGTYYLKVFSDDLILCTLEKTFTVSQPDKKLITVDSIIDTDSLSSGSGAIYISTDTAGYVFQWTGPDNFISQDEDITGLEAGCYSLTAEDTISGCSIDTTICIKYLTANHELQNKKSIRIYPNPVKDILFIDIGSNELENYEISLLDLSGKIIKTVNNSPNKSLLSIDISGINAGFYLIKIHSDKSGIFCKKLIKFK